MKYFFTSLVATVLIGSSGASAQPEAKPAFVPIDAAHAGTLAAITTCQKMGYQVAAAVVDANGNARLTIALDDAHYLAGNLAMAKAKTAVLGAKATISGAAPAHPDPSANRSINKSPDNAVGLPIAGPDGQLVGGVGVAGAPSMDDNDVCARAALDAIKDQLKQLAAKPR